MTETKSGVTVGNLAVFADVYGNVKDGGAPNHAVGSVTSVSVVTANGVSGAVANPTSTPAITLTLGAITPSSVNASGTVAGSNLSGTNTGDATAINQVLTGFTPGSGTVSSSDTVLQAIEKLDGNTALLTGAVIFKGTWNASTNTPTLVSGVGNKGDLYKVSVAGTTTIDGISQWNVGDSIVFDGTVWDKIDGLASEVISVNGLVGVVVITDVNLSTSDNTTNDVSTSKHGFAPKSPGSASVFLDGTGAYSTPAGAVSSVNSLTGAVVISDANLSVTDITTHNVSTSAHGFAPKLPNDATKFLDGTGAYSTPTGAVTSVQGSTGAVTITDANLSTSDVTTNDVSSSKHGFAPKTPNDATKFLNGTGAWTVPSGGASGKSIVEFASTQTGSGMAAGTHYFANNTDTTSSGNVYIRMPFAGTVTAMYADTPVSGPGSGHSFIYTLQKNAVDTAVTCTTVNGNTSSNDTGHSVAFNAGDTLVIKCVIDAGGAQTTHNVTLSITT